MTISYYNNNEVKTFNNSRLEQIKIVANQGLTKRGKLVDKSYTITVSLNDEVLETNVLSAYRGEQAWINLFETMFAKYPEVPQDSIKTIELWDIDAALAKMNAITQEQETAEFTEVLEGEFDIFAWYDKEVAALTA